jgi:hypothetical protein
MPRLGFYFLLTVAALAFSVELFLEEKQGERGRVSIDTDVFNCNKQSETVTLPSQLKYLPSLWLIPGQSKGDHIIIDVGPATFQSRQQIMALASRNSAACENVRSVEIRSAALEPFGPSGKLVSSILDVKQKVPKAIECLRNVENVS